VRHPPLPAETEVLAAVQTLELTGNLPAHQ
jgi:hypothetical protein